MRGVNKFVSATDRPWDDVLVERGIIQATWHLLSSVSLQIGLPHVLVHDLTSLFLTRLAVVYTAVNVAWIINIGLWGLQAWYAALPVARNIPIRSFVQAARILTVAATVLVTVSALSGESVIAIIGALGAATAIILLVTRDSISSLVAGMQVVASGMVRVGDWIQVGTADGEVIDVTLQAIEIRNWDRSVSHIPMSQLLSGTGFKNFRNQVSQSGMHILTTIYADISTVDQIGSNPPNLTQFRDWIMESLRNDDRISFVQYVRQLPIDRLGIPIEIAAFSVTTDWSEHERLQADIITELIAAMDRFQLRPAHARADPQWDKPPESE